MTQSPGNRLGSDKGGEQGISVRPRPFYELRTVETILYDWMLETSLSPQHFLRNILGLEGALTADQWNAILTGDAVPSLPLAYHIAARLPTSMASYTVFMNAVMRGRYEKMEKGRLKAPEIIIDQKIYEDARNRHVDQLMHQLLQKRPQKGREKQEPVEQHDADSANLSTSALYTVIAHQIKRVMGTLEADMVDVMIENIASTLSIDAHSIRYQQPLAAGMKPAEIAEQLADTSALGDEKAKVEIRKLAMQHFTVETAETHVYNRPLYEALARYPAWDKAQFSYKFSPGSFSATNANDLLLAWKIGLRKPNVVEFVYVSGELNLNSRQRAALVRNILGAPYKTLAQEMRHYRWLQGITQRQAALNANLTPITVHRWETDYHRLGREDYRREASFSSLCNTYKIPRAEQNRLISTYIFPSKEENKHSFGELLTFYRWRQGMDIEALAGLLELPVKILAEWEEGKGYPSSTELATLCLVLEPDEYEKEEFYRKAFARPIKTVGDKIQFYRWRQGMRQIDLAAQVGVDERVIRRWEKGIDIKQPSHFSRLVAALHLTKWELSDLIQTKLGKKAESFWEKLDFYRWRAGVDGAKKFKDAVIPNPEHYYQLCEEYGLSREERQDLYRLTFDKPFTRFIDLLRFYCYCEGVTMTQGESITHIRWGAEQHMSVDRALSAITALSDTLRLTAKEEVQLQRAAYGIFSDSKGDKIKFYRLRAGLTVEQLADKLEVSSKAVNLWESNQIFLFRSKLLPFKNLLSLSETEFRDLAAPYISEPMDSAGGLLCYYRLREGKNEKQLAESAGLSENAVKTTESNLFRTHEEALVKMMKALRLTEAERVEIIRAAIWMPPDSFGGQLAFHRLKEGYTQKEAAATLGISLMSLARYERFTDSPYISLHAYQIPNMRRVFKLSDADYDKLVRSIVPRYTSGLGHELYFHRMKNGMNRQEIQKLVVSPHPFRSYEIGEVIPDEAYLENFCRELKIVDSKHLLELRRKEIANRETATAEERVGGEISMAERVMQRRQPSGNRRESRS